MRFQRTTGLSPYQLRRLIETVEQKIPDWDKPVGRPHALPLWRAVILVCWLLRHNDVQELVAELWEISQATVSRYGTLLRPVIRDLLKQLGFGIKRLPRGEPVLVDGFLAECWDWKAVKQLFSKQHMKPGHNVQVTPDTRGHLQAVGNPVPGARHDAYAYEASGIKEATRGHPGVGDKGYQGCGLYTPYKKPVERKLTEWEKDCNRAHSCLRAPVERCIGHLESWKVFGGCYRGPLDTFPEVLETVTQLELYRVWSPA